MSKKYNVSKKNKGNTTGIIIGLIGMACVGALGAFSQGFKDWNYKEWFKTSETTKEDTRVGLKIVNLECGVQGQLLTNTTIISYFNGGLGEESEPIFKDVEEITNEDQSTSPLLKNSYKDSGALKLGSKSETGSFTINLVDSYTFNRCKIEGRNYSYFNGQTKIYPCDETSISVNGQEMQSFTTNVVDNTMISPIETKQFNFGTPQNKLKIETSGKRCIIYSIELWTE